jgi:pimeloyl-ACP methyl ester carboxylesterase
MALHAAHVHRGDRFPHAICLLAPFVSAASVRLAHTRLALRLTSVWSALDVFKMKESALEQGHPLFVATGDADEVIPPAHGRAIADYAAKHGVAKFVLVPGATHASIRSDRAGLVYPSFLEFLSQLYCKGG